MTIVRICTRMAAIITGAVGLALAAPPVFADDARVRALEQRVADLEAMVRMLAGEQQPPAPVVTAPPAAADSGTAPPAHTFKLGGFVKVDGMFSDYSAGDLAPGSAGSQLYIPSTVPVGSGPGEGPDADFQARETRLNMSSTHAVGGGNRLATFVELDFYLGSGGDERVSNSYNPRLRHAYIQYNNWLFGQTWSTFQDASPLTENLDLVGPAEGRTFVRQAMIRYTHGAWEFAAENPETTITPFGGGTRIVTDDGTLPDLVARYTTSLRNGHIRIAGLLRQLDYDFGTASDTQTAFGLSVSGKHDYGRDDLRWMATIGSGTGRYLGLNTSNDAVLNAAGKLDAINQFGGFASYRHFWPDPKWRSNFTVSYLANDNEISLTGSGVTKSVYSLHANLLYEPLPKFILGGELVFAQREIESGADGSLTRLILSARYGF